MKDSVELKIDIWRCFYTLRRNAAIIALATLLSFVGTCLLTGGAAGNVYQAYATVYSTAGDGYDLEQAAKATSAMRQYANVITSLKVLNRAAEQINDESITGHTLSKMVSVNSKADSSVLQIVVHSPNPNLAVTSANAVAAAFTSEIASITGQSNVHVLDTADFYVMIQNGSRQKWFMRFLCAALACGLCCAGFLLADILSPKIRSMHHAGLNGDVDIIGLIPDFNANAMSQAESSRRGKSSIPGLAKRRNGKL